MKDSDITEKLRALKKLEPHAEALSAVESRVFAAVDAEISRTTTPIRSPYVLYLRRGQLLGMVAVFCCVFVLANQLPRYSAYESSISSLAETQRLTEEFEQDTADVGEVTDAVSRTRDAFNSLSLKGTFGLYTMEQCRSAYILYDQYLDYTLQTIDQKKHNTSDENTQRELTALEETLRLYRKEAQDRVGMYQ